jgi:hypothetical protein
VVQIGTIASNTYSFFFGYLFPTGVLFTNQFRAHDI